VPPQPRSSSGDALPQRCEVIEIRIAELRQLFNAIDPSPFREREMNSIEAYIQFERGLIGEDGVVNDESTREFLQDYMAEFHGFIARVYTVVPRNA